MFGRKARRIRELEYDKTRREQELRNLRHEMATYEKKLEHVRKCLDSTPEDCTPGRWCEACDFSKCIHIYNPCHDDFERVYVCNRGEACKNFIQKESRQL